MTEHDGDRAERPDLLHETVEIVSAYLTNNKVAAEELPQLIATVRSALAKAGRPVPTEPPQKPAVALRKSVTPDYIVCLECGAKLSMLKRHLQTHHATTPEDYRSKWSLPQDYPMVAPNYAARRSDLARRIGLGKVQGRRGRQRGRGERRDTPSE